ncbi:MAG: DNA internalization-related competence protein ComEC/Rec2 [Betaproteobacteria bacterium]|nr:DNA internalization-related competence protein ComEC/Rec2 [Betaproteobacteria bacterium]
MCTIVFGILLGVCWLQWATNLPFWAAWGWVPAAASLAVIVFCSHARVAGLLRGVQWMPCLAAAFVLGYAWAAWRADFRMADALDPALEGRDLLLTGVIASLPEERGDGIRFVFEVEYADAAGCEKPPDRAGVPQQVLLSWYGGRERAGLKALPLPVVQPGERWQLPVRLQRPHGAAAPGVFDYEAWLLERGLRATGYVRGNGVLVAAETGGWMNQVHRLRARIRHNFEAALPDAPYYGILVALTVGDQGAIGAEQWEILRRTGIAHLVAISGSHITLVALAVGGLCVLVWRRLPWLSRRCPARLAGAVAGLAAAGVYALFAGLSIPVQRALVMLAVAALYMTARRETSARNVLSLALLAVLAMDPWAPLAAGFWLSFGAVAVILLTLNGRVKPERGWQSAVRIQLAITLALIPILVALFQGFSLASPFGNALAIPMVEFAITPLALLAMIVPAGWVLGLAHLFTAWMMVALGWLSGFSLALYEHPLPPAWLLAGATAAVSLLILPRGTPGRLGALAILGGFFLWQPERPQSGDFRVAVLDVGQGLAVHVQTARHDLLYDSGPFFGDASDAGERVVVPYLRATGVGRLDAALISHDDGDHAGGLESVLARVRIDKVFAGGEMDEHVASFGSGTWNARDARLRPVRGTPCVAGLHWQWDEVDFTVLAPVRLSGKRRGNDESCVLRVSAAGGASLLLTGDLGQAGENGLVRQYGSALKSTAVLAGHHGSRSSSSLTFVEAAYPEIIVFSSGYHNRYGHPHPQVLARWARTAARPYRTDSGGTVLLETKSGRMKASNWRDDHPRYWYGR